MKAVLERKPAATNPLRKWREAQDPRVTLIAAALRLGVSITTIKEWEGGSLTPKDENFARIATLLKTPLHDLTEAWSRWLGRVTSA